MGISDRIAEFIRKLLEEEDGMAKLSRIELAQKFDCAPSQINYVLNTRFSPEHGFVVVSRRGGGGYILITRVRLDTPCLIMHSVNAVGGYIDIRTAAALIDNLLAAGVVSPGSAKMLIAATSAAALKSVPQKLRDETRASVLKHCLLSML